MHKDKLTGQEIIDYDFLGTKLFPPKKMKVTDAGREFEALFRELDKCHYSRKKERNDFSSLRGRGGGERKQPCVVKMYYTDNKQAHIEFLRNYMPQKNKKEVEDKPELFNENYDVVPEKEILKYEKNAADRGFKFIISPENQNVDMKALVRQFVKNLEKITGHTFSWMAVTHTDTGHIHSHLLINGIDSKTKEEFKFDHTLIKSTARNLAIDICTSLVGHRSREQIESARLSLPYAKRWTKLDEQIVGTYGYNEFKNGKIVGGCEYESEKTTADSVEIQRLNTLVDMGLALAYKKERPPRYYLEKGWRQKLKAVGRYNTYLEARKNMRFTPYQNLELYNNDMGEIEGIVSQIYNMDDEYIWNNAVVIENRRLGKAWYVPTRIKLNNEDIGKFISVKAEKNQKGKIRPLITIQK